MKVNFNLSVIFLKEGRRFIAHSPALDLATSGKSFTEAKERFEEAASIFFEEITRKGTVNEVLTGLGWIKQKQVWLPPIMISRSVESISVPATV